MIHIVWAMLWPLWLLSHHPHSLFHPASSCSQQWLGVLWWWQSGLCSLEVSWVNQQGHMTTHLTRSLVPEYHVTPWNGYGVAWVRQTQTHTHTCAYPWHIITGLPVPVSFLNLRHRVDNLPCRRVVPKIQWDNFTVNSCSLLFIISLHSVLYIFGKCL
jgi:hypothetical protein